jgi:hypothetical protein
VKYAFIARQRQIWPIRWQCAALSVSASGFYEWLGRAESNRAKANRELLKTVSNEPFTVTPSVSDDYVTWTSSSGD